VISHPASRSQAPATGHQFSPLDGVTMPVEAMCCQHENISVESEWVGLSVNADAVRSSMTGDHAQQLEYAWKNCRHRVLRQHDAKSCGRRYSHVASVDKFSIV
jgi:hypothetical protein